MEPLWSPVYGSCYSTGLLICESFYSFNCHVLCVNIALRWYLGMTLHEQKCPYRNLCRDRLQLLMILKRAISWQKRWTRTQTELVVKWFHMWTGPNGSGAQRKVRLEQVKTTDVSWLPDWSLIYLVTFLHLNLSTQGRRYSSKSCLHNQPGRKEKKYIVKRCVQRETGCNVLWNSGRPYHIRIFEWKVSMF